MIGDTAKVPLLAPISSSKNGMMRFTAEIKFLSTMVLNAIMYGRRGKTPTIAFTLSLLVHNLMKTPKKITYRASKVTRSLIDAFTTDSGRMEKHTAEVSLLTLLGLVMMDSG